MGNQLQEHLLWGNTPVREAYTRHAVYYRQNLHIKLRSDCLW